MVWTVRRAELGELDVLTQIESICFPPEEAAERESIKARLHAFGAWFFVAQAENGEIVGMINGMATDEQSIADAMFADASLHQADGAVQTVFGLDVLPAYRKQGVADALMRAFVLQAKAAGRTKVTLTCKEHLIGMYEHFGYVNKGVSRSVHGGAVWYDMDLAL